MDTTCRANFQKPVGIRYIRTLTISHSFSGVQEEELFSGHRLSTWLIHWGETADTGFHDHARSAAVVYAIRGRVRDERLKIGREPAGNENGPGETFTVVTGGEHQRRGDLYR